MEEYDKQDTVTNIEFESIVPSIRRYFFNQCTVDFMHKLELSDQKYKTIGNVRDENYNERFLYLMKNFLSFVTYCHSMYFMSTRLLKGKINGFRVSQFQLAYIREKNNPLHIHLVKLCHELHYMWSVN